MEFSMSFGTEVRCWLPPTRHGRPWTMRCSGSSTTSLRRLYRPSRQGAGQDYDALSLALEPVFAARKPLRAVDITFDTRNVSVSLRRIVGPGFDRLLVQSDASDCFEKAVGCCERAGLAPVGALRLLGWACISGDELVSAGALTYSHRPKSIARKGSEPTCREGKRPTTARAHR